MSLKKPNKSFSAADTEKAMEMLKDMYIMGRETGHPLYSDEWKLVEEDLAGLNYDREKVKSRFEELCNI